MLEALLFDVNGTLTDTSPVGGVWGRPELGDPILQQAVSTAMVETLLDRPTRAFADHLQAALEVVVADAKLDESLIERAGGVATALPARPGAREALGILRDAGLRLAALTNSGAEAGRRTLEACGLAPNLDLVLGVDAVGRFKPHPDVYTYAVSKLERDRAEVALVATHPWDLAGAARCGLRTAWVKHDGARAWPGVFPAPDVEASTLEDLATELVALAAPE